MTLGAARVIWTLVDLSMFVDEVALGYVTMVIKAERGPIGKVRIISSLDEYRRIYGLKVDYTTDPLVCEMALRQGGRLNLIRTAHYENVAVPETLQALKSSVVIKDRGASIAHAYLESADGPFVFVQAASGICYGSVEGPFTIGNSTKYVSFKVRHNGTWGSAVDITLTTGTRSASQVALEIAAGTGIAAEAHQGKVWVYCENVEDDLEVCAKSNDAYSVLGLIEGQYPHTDGQDKLFIEVNGGSSQEFTLVYNSTYSGRVTTEEEGPFTIVADSADTLKIRVRHSGEWKAAQTLQLMLGEGEETISVDDVVDAIAALDDISAVATTSDKITISATDVMDDIEIMEVTKNCYTVMGLTPGVYTRTPTSLPGATFTLSASNIVSQIDAAGLSDAVPLLSGGRVGIRTNKSGSAATLQVTEESSAAPVLGFDFLEYAGYEGTEEDCFTVESINEGSWGNDLRIFIYDSALNPKTHFNMRVGYMRQPGVSEWYTDLSMDPNDARYIVGIINGISDLITVTDEHSSNDFFTDIGWINRPKLTDVYIGRSLRGGDDGLTNFNDADWIGDSVSQSGIYAADGAQMSMDLMVPGTTSPTVFQAMIAYCEDRADMLGYGMTPYGMEPEDTVDWRLGNPPWSHPAFNSPRFSLWFGRPLVYDDMDNTKKYISNLGHLASCLCKTDNNYGPSWAPVGPRRGTVTLVEDVDFDIQTNRRTGYADLFAENGINYLMISRYKGIEGAMFWEQRTTFRGASARRELNVMRFVTMVNRALMPMLRTFIFEPNHPMTWREIHRILEPAFEDWKNKYAIYDYAIQTDRDAWFDGGVLRNAVLNSGLDIDRGIYHCRALIQPTRAIYYLDFSLVLTRTGEAFEQYMDTKVLPGWVTS